MPSGVDFDSAINNCIKRRTVSTVTDEQKIASRNYVIGGMTYRVNSIFDIASKKTVIDDVKHLIDTEMSRVS